MYEGQRVAAIVPARDEALNIEAVVGGLLALKADVTGLPVVDWVVVCDNGSTDDTANLARDAGALVVHESRPGYGQACLTAIQSVESLPVAADVLLFVDGDQSVDLSEVPDLLAPLTCPLVDGKTVDMVIGARQKLLTEKGAQTLPQRFGNELAAFLIRWIWRAPVSDLGPFRAIRYEAYKTLDMKDVTFGWTTEMQVKAILQGLLTREVPVSCKCRLGTSKISGTLSGVVGAARGILGTIFKLWLWQNSDSGKKACVRGKARRSINAA